MASAFDDKGKEPADAQSILAIVQERPDTETVRWSLGFRR
jgi:hypothetical protein